MDQTKILYHVWFYDDVPVFGKYNLTTSS